MMPEAKAFAPANISCIFKIYSRKNPRWAGSYGVGFTLNKGVAVKVNKSKRTEIFFNNKKINFPTVKSAVKKLTKQHLEIRIASSLPLGCGFGLSGAGALAAVYAASRLLSLKKTNKELAIIAHIAEVKNKTGLGDVVNQFYGGFCVKLKPSSYFAVKKLPINANVYCRHFSGISTKSIITNQRLKARINNAADISLKKIQRLIKEKKDVKFGDVIRISKEFSMNSGLLKDKKTIETIKNIEKNNGNASMIMLGNAVFSDKPFKGAMKIGISEKGACII